MHHYAFFGAQLLRLLLVASSPLGLAGVAAAFLAASSSAMFRGSAMYHRITWSATQRMRLAWLDHAMIYVVMTSTYAASALLELSGWPEGVVLSLVGAGAAAA